MAFSFGCIWFWPSDRASYKCDTEGAIRKSHWPWIYTPYAGKEWICGVQRWLGGGGKSNSESVMHFQTNGEAKCAGYASPRSVAPAGAANYFYVYPLSWRQTCWTWQSNPHEATVLSMHVTVTQCGHLRLENLNVKPSVDLREYETWIFFFFYKAETNSSSFKRYKYSRK